ncbi:bifunctional metallophosphatase/5'-nucleotidase [Myxococcota bacterium]|nr:bifunctional metallophosphatase/5'-nucleotidase [Myxococcota bacterium]
MKPPQCPPGPLAVVGLVAAVASAGCTVRGWDPDLAGQDVRLTILHTSDIHSRLIPYAYTPNFTEQEQLGLDPDRGPFGGIARIAHIVGRERARAQRVLHLDSGDCFQGAPIFNVFGGEAEVRAMSELGVDAAVVGNHEFDRGAANLADQLDRWLGYRALAANYRFDSDEFPWNTTLDSLVDEVAIFDLDGLTVGVIGMANLSSISSIGEGDNSLDVEAQGDLDTTEAWGAALEPLVDLTVVVSHLGLENDEEIARRSRYVDLIIGGHLHVAIDPPKVIESEAIPGKRIVVCHSGAFAKYVGRLDLVIRDGEVLTHDYTLFPVDSTVPEDPDMLDLIRPYEVEMARVIELDRVIGVVGDLDGDGQVQGTDEEEFELDRFAPSGGDSPLGNLIAHAIQTRNLVETDFAVTNSLGIRTNIQAGDVTLEELFNVLPFDNAITTLFLSGEEVQELFDYVTERSASRGCNTQAQIAGARFVMNCESGLAEQVTVGGTWQPCQSDGDCDLPTERCSAGACGVPVFPGYEYELATNDYIAYGGSGFDVLERNTTKVDTGISLRDAVIDYIEAHPRLPADAPAAESDGRITPVY